MKKLLVAFGLCAALVSSLSLAARPASADPSQLPQLNMVQMPEPQNLQLRQIAPLNLNLAILPLKAELTSQVFVGPSPYAGFKRIYCYVKNSGFAHSGWFKTLIRIHRPGLSTIEAIVPTPSLAPGGSVWITGVVYVPTGIQRVFSFADVTYVVPEYNEFNNWDSIP